MEAAGDPSKKPGHLPGASLRVADSVVAEGLANPLNGERGLEHTLVVREPKVVQLEMADTAQRGFTEPVGVTSQQQHIVVVNRPEHIRIGLQCFPHQLLHYVLSQNWSPTPPKGKAEPGPGGAAVLEGEGLPGDTCW